MFARIVVANDGSEGGFKALAMGCELARRDGAALHMISVEELPDFPASIDEIIDRLGRENGEITARPALDVAGKSPGRAPGHGEAHCALALERGHEIEHHRFEAVGAENFHVTVLSNTSIRGIRPRSSIPAVLDSGLLAAASHAAIPR